jgi:CBS domain containing-hemolysin-like protein
LIVMYVIFTHDASYLIMMSRFAEIIPQSLCTRHGLYLGAKMAKPTQGLIYTLVSTAFPSFRTWLCSAIPITYALNH